jgi:hypothetical protein
MSTYSPPLLPPPHISIPPSLHFDRWPILAPMLSSPHGPTLLHTTPYRSRARIPPDTPLSLFIHLRVPKRSPVLVQCPWIPRLLVAPPPRSLPTFLLPSPATFLWKTSPLNLPTLLLVCDRLLHPSLVSLSTVPTHRDVNAIRQNPLPSFAPVRLRPSFAFVCPTCALLAGDEEGRLSPAASGSGFSRLSRAFVFVSGSSFSCFSRVPADVFPPLSQLQRWPPLARKCDLGVDPFSPLRLPLLPFAPVPCHVRSPLFVLVRPRLPRSLVTKRVASPLPPLAASGSGFSFLFLFLSRVCPSFVSHRFVLMPFPALSQVHNGPLSLANMNGGVDLAATAARRRSSLFGSVFFFWLCLVRADSLPLAGARRLCPLSVV